ncbi:MAG: apolipoprotein N-acyltransferase, partial [Acidimicrobiales bacterium]
GRLLLVALVGTAGVGLAGLAARRWRAGAAAIAVVGVAAVAGSLAVGASLGPAFGPLSVAAVQGGGPRGLRAVETDEGEVLRAHLAASERVRPPVGLVLWPEDVIDVPAVAGSDADAQMAALARRLGAPVVAGVVEDVDSKRFRNAAVVWAPDGRRTDRYDKVHRVPFGEYVPARRFFGLLADLSAVPRDAVAGRGAGVVDTAAGRMGVLISYEVFFADRARAAVQAGGQVLLVPTNASSYRDAQVPAQELAAARLRALETGRWVVQAAPTGYSAVVDPSGRVHERSRLGTREVLTSTVQRRTGQTLAVRLGGLWPTAMAVAVLGLANRRRH